MKIFLSAIRYFFLGLIGLLLAIYIVTSINYYAAPLFFNPMKKQFVDCARQAKQAVPKGFAICEIKESKDDHYPADMIIYDSSGQLEKPHCNRSLSWQHDVNNYSYFGIASFSYQKLAKNYYKIFFDLDHYGKDYIYDGAGAWEGLKAEPRCREK